MKATSLDGIPELTHQPHQHPQVVDRGQPVGQDFPGHEQVAQVCAAEPGARVAVAAVFERPRVARRSFAARICGSVARSITPRRWTFARLTSTSIGLLVAR